MYNSENIPNLVWQPSEGFPGTTPPDQPVAAEPPPPPPVPDILFTPPELPLTTENPFVAPPPIVPIAPDAFVPPVVQPIASDAFTPPPVVQVFAPETHRAESFFAPPLPGDIAAPQVLGNVPTLTSDILSPPQNIAPRQTAYVPPVRPATSLPPSPYAGFAYPVPPAPPQNPASKGKCIGRGVIVFLWFMLFSVVLPAIPMFGWMFLHFDLFRDFNPYFDGDFDPETIAFAYRSMASVVWPALLGFEGISILFFWRLVLHESKPLPVLQLPNLKPRPAPFALSQPGTRASVAVFPVIIIGAAAANIFFTVGLQVFLNQAPQFAPNPIHAYFNQPNSVVGAVCMLIATAVVIPVAEEFCFRRLLFNHLRRGFSFVWANVIQGVFFGAIHGFPNMIYAILLGLFLGWVYEKTRRFSACLVTHITFNATALALDFTLHYAYPGGRNLGELIDEICRQPANATLFVLLPGALILVGAVAAIFGIANRRTAVDN